MGSKKILSVGFAFPGDLVEFVSLEEKRSLLDGDVIIFRPSVSGLARPDFQNPRYQGKLNLTEDSSFDLKNAASHWRQQIQMAVSAGKSVFVFLPEPQDVWVDSGQRTYSGTGRGQKTTVQVEPFSNYRMLPTFCDSVLATVGRHMKLAPDASVLAPYWADFGPHSEYKVVFEGLKVPACITTATGDIGVSCTFTIKGGRGSVVALPALAEYDVDPEDLADDHRWTKEQKQFGHRLLASLLVVDEALRGLSAVMPPPDWATGHEFVLLIERELSQEILALDQEVEASLGRKAELSKRLERESQLRRLLYEKGKPLEQSILLALKTLGFRAEGFEDTESEFDAVFVSDEGRFLGEAEGKDAAAINIDKLRQLEMNVQEDFARDGVAEYARGVLFGNAYRLKPPIERPAEFFTTKCLTAAARSGSALVRTPDIFLAAKYVKETGDQSYAKACRRALLEQGGRVVQFPPVPSESSRQTVMVVAGDDEPSDTSSK